MNAAPAIGLSALTAGQRALDVIGQNIANASTPGYHRQEVVLADRVYDGVHGVGVDVQRVRRFEDWPLHRGVLTASSDSSMSQAQLNIEQQVESFWTSASLGKQVGSFFDGLQMLSTRPDDLTLRRTVLATAAGLSTSLNQLSSSLTTTRANVGHSIEQTVSDVNAETAKIAKLNGQIAQVELGGQDANDLKDQRDQLIDDLAAKIDVRVTQQDNGMLTIIAANAAVVVGSISQDLAATTDPSGNYYIYASDPTQPLKPQSGQLAGLLQEYNQALPDYQSRLDAFAAALIQSVDEVQATGLGLNGALTSANGTRGVNNTAVPLNAAGLALPAQAGELFISVTNSTAGVRTLNSITIDPATQSLQDIATAITSSTSGQVQASIDPLTNTLQLQAAAGFTFDFAGRLPSVPDSVAMNGTAVPTVTGTFSGAANDVYSFQVVGNGTVGVTPGLALEVRDGNGTLLNTLNVGDGYTPGTSLVAANGIRVQLSAGTTNAGAFSTRVIAQPDTANILSSLGLNRFFDGVNAASIAVRPELLNNPALLSAARSRSPGILEIWNASSRLRDQPLLTGGTQTLEQQLGDSLGIAGNQVKALTLNRQTSQSIHDSLYNQEQSEVGVDTNEEMVKLLEFQRMVEAGSRYLSVTNSAMDEIMNIIK